MIYNKRFLKALLGGAYLPKPALRLPYIINDGDQPDIPFSLLQLLEGRKTSQVR